MNVLPLPGPWLVLHTKDRAVALAVDGYENRTASDKTPSHYEEDHFISLELGGNPRDPKSLWPEMWGTPGTPLTSRGPFPPHLVGAKAKDAVENELHKEVCAGMLTLQEAQQIIVTDWSKYYRNHVLKEAWFHGELIGGST